MLKLNRLMAKRARFRGACSADKFFAPLIGDHKTFVVKQTQRRYHMDIILHEIVLLDVGANISCSFFRHLGLA